MFLYATSGPPNRLPGGLVSSRPLSAVAASGRALPAHPRAPASPRCLSRRGWEFGCSGTVRAPHSHGQQQ